MPLEKFVKNNITNKFKSDIRQGNQGEVLLAEVFEGKTEQLPAKGDLRAR